MGTTLKVVQVPIGELVPYANNSKEHTDWQIQQIVASIKQFGNCDPVGIWHDADGQPIIVEGHGKTFS